MVRQGLLRQGRIGTRRPLQDPIRFVWKCNRGPTPLLADYVEEGVGRDTTEPTLDVAGLIVDQAPLNAKEDVLNDVLRIVMVSGEPVREPVQEAPMVVGNFLPRGNRSYLRQLYQTPWSFRRWRQSRFRP